MTHSERTLAGELERLDKLPVNWIVTCWPLNQHPSKAYHFSDEVQARMFQHSVLRDGERAELVKVIERECGERKDNE